MKTKQVERKKQVGKKKETFMVDVADYSDFCSWFCE
jgi:hypothetical protein